MMRWMNRKRKGSQVGKGMQMRVGMTAMWTSLWLIGAILAASQGQPTRAEAQGGGGEAQIIHVDGIINPVVLEYITEGIDRAEREDATLLVIKLDTPGGMVSSTEDIVKKMLNASVPIVVYVSPSGGRAASAGVFITLAAHVAAMAPNTHIGAAHPVGGQGEDIEGDMRKKIENDMVATIKNIAERRGRNVEWAVEAVLESVSATSEEALELKVIDVVTPSIDELLQAIDGREVETASGTVTLATSGIRVKTMKMDWRHRVLNALANPNIAYILLSFGTMGIIGEFYSPGAIFPGVFGAICLILAFFAFQVLPVSYTGILLILLAVVLFILEVKVTSYGLLTIGGVLTMTLGSIMLIDSPDPAMQVSWKVIAPVVLCTAGFFVFALTYAFRAQLLKPTTGREGLIGEVGKAHGRLAPEGKIFVHGEYWDARSDEEIEEGDRVRVVKMEGMLLYVEKA